MAPLYSFGECIQPHGFMYHQFVFPAQTPLPKCGLTFTCPLNLSSCLDFNRYFMLYIIHAELLFFFFKPALLGTFFISVDGNPILPVV